MTDASPRFRSVLDGFPAYQPGRTPVSSDGKTHKLSSNESPYAPLPSVVDVITEAARSVNRYPDNGAEGLIQAIADKFGVPTQHVAVGCGSVGVAQQLFEAIGEPGAEVIYAWRSFEAYPILSDLAAADSVRVPLRGETHDLAAMAAAITPRTRLILLNSPHNPTGAVFSRAELTAIADLAVEHDLLVITDEVYEHMVFDGEHVPIVTLPGMAGRTVTISSAGKTFAFTGWKIGWVTGSAELVTAVRTVKQFLTFVNGGPFQYAVAEGLALPDSYYAQLNGDLRARRDLLCDGLAEAGFAVYRPAGTYFVTTDISALGETDGIAFCRSLPERAGVVAIPAAVFYDDAKAGESLVRFAFCKKPEVLEEALTRLRRGLAPA